MKTLTVISDLPNVPSVYAMYGGQGSALHCAYVGVAGKLKQRVIQHLVRRDRSVTTGTSTVALNPEFITQVRWWEHPEFSERHFLEASELVAFDVLDPVLRSRGAMSDRARELYKIKDFTDKMHNLFSGEPTGCLVILTLQDAFAKIAEIERRLNTLEEGLSGKNRTNRTQPEIHDFPLLQQFPTQFELLKRLFGDQHFLSNIINVRRLNKIFEISEKKWTANLNRLKDEEVKYLLIAEAPPCTESGEVRYFHNSFKSRWHLRIWNAFCPKHKSESDEIAYKALAEKGFLLIDSLPFAAPYSAHSQLRKTDTYAALLRACSLFLLQKLRNPLIKWAENVKVALAFELNGNALIDAFADGLPLPTGQVLHLQSDLIAADGSGYTNSKKLRAVFGLVCD